MLSVGEQGRARSPHLGTSKRIFVHNSQSQFIQVLRFIETSTPHLLSPTEGVLCPLTWSDLNPGVGGRYLCLP